MSAVPNLNRRLILETRLQAPDGAGGYSETWVVLGTLWGRLAARAGRERRGEGGALAQGSYRITVRGAPPGQSRRPEPGQRMWSGGRVFRILAVVEDDPDGRFLDCFAEEEVAV